VKKTRPTSSTKLRSQKSAAGSETQELNPQFGSTNNPKPEALARAGEIVQPWPKGVRFRWNADGSTSAEVCHGTSTKVTVTYRGVADDMHQVRAMVVAASKRGCTPSISDLRNHIRGTRLSEIADDRDLATWIEIFSGGDPTPPKAASLVFLEQKTGLERATLKTYFSKSSKSST
jgi:hypothetical protein